MGAQVFVTLCPLVRGASLLRISPQDHSAEAAGSENRSTRARSLWLNDDNRLDTVRRPATPSFADRLNIILLLRLILIRHLVPSVKRVKMFHQTRLDALDDNHYGCKRIVAT